MEGELVINSINDYCEGEHILDICMNEVGVSVTRYLDLDKPQYKQKMNPGFSSKQKTNELHSVSRHEPNEIGITLHKK